MPSNRWMTTAACLGAVCMGLFTTAPAWAQSPEPTVAAQTAPDFEAVRALVRQIMEQANVPSMAVAVVRDGEILFEEAMGLADREAGVPATVHTPYSLASMTKPIMATAVMKLREEGRIDIDAPIETYLGGLRLTGHAGRTEDVTARRIMSHSAGLPQYGHFYLDGAAPAGPEETIRRFGMVVFPPNTRFEYSNIGMEILNVAVARASGLSSADFLDREIFGPLGMGDSWMRARDGAVPAVRYDNERRRMRDYQTDHPGSGEVWASAHDLARFLAFHMGAPLPGQTAVLSDASRLEMQRPASAFPMPAAPGAPRRDVGANWLISPINGHPQIWHSGSQPGVSTFMAFYPEQGLGMVILANSSAPLSRISNAIRAAVAPELVEQPAAPPAREPQPLPFTGRWVGTATNYLGSQPITISFADGGAVVQLGGQPAAPLEGAGFDNGALTGRFAATSDMPETAKATHGFWLEAASVDGELVGEIVAQGLSRDVVFTLPSFVRLHPEGTD